MSNALILNNGTVVAVGEVDLAKLKSDLNNTGKFLIKVGNKAITRGMFVACVGEDALNPDGKNVKVTVGKHNVFLATDDINVFIDVAVDEVNNNEYSLLNDQLVVGKGFVQVIEGIQ